MRESNENGMDFSTCTFADDKFVLIFFFFTQKIICKISLWWNWSLGPERIRFKPYVGDVSEANHFASP